jgi:hypothetical protein
MTADGRVPGFEHTLAMQRSEPSVEHSDVASHA